jgi:hypothetical protein
MKYVFFDETGNLSTDFNKHSVSKNFYLVFLDTKDQKQIEKVIKKIMASRKTHKISKGFLHAYNDDPKNVARTLRYLAKKEFAAYVLICDKTKWRASKTVNQMYHKVLVEGLEKLSSQKVFTGSHHLLLARYFAKNKDEQEFIKDVAHKLPKLNFNIELSRHSKCLQAVDYVAWAVYQKHEYDDEQFYKIIADKVVTEELS